jgi:Pyruvate/2-oxoacid:ferredoxin oxidoreductase delta subunit
MVVEFLKGLDLKSQPYIFAVATCGGTPGRTLLQLRGILRKSGADLQAGFVTKEGSNSVAEAPGFIKFVESISGQPYGSGRDRLYEINKIIRSGKEHRPETSSLPANFVGGLLHKMSSLAADSIKAFDKNYLVDDKCTMCRTCERVCPMANIRVDGGKPVWNHNCGGCNACIQWCPQQAIHIKNETCRYHHPDIKASDLMLR